MKPEVEASTAKSERLGLLEVISIGVGGMVGGGIFSVLGLSMHIAGHAVPLTFTIGSIIALLTAVSYAKLGLCFRSDGGSFTYLEHAFSNKNVAGIGGWLLVGGYIGTTALYSYTFGAYASAMFGHSMLAHKLLSAAVLVVFLAINLIGVKSSGLTEDLIVGLKLVILVIFGGIGINTIQPANILPVFNEGVANVFTAAAVIFVAYEGFELIPNVVDEMEDPERDLPLGLLSAILIVSVLYILLSIVACGNLTPDQIDKYKEYALAVAAKPALGKIGFTAISIAALLSTASAINATLFGSARLATTMANEKALPRVFSLREKGSGIPWFSLVSLTAASAALCLTTSLTTISGVSSGMFLLIFSFINAAAFRLSDKIKIRKTLPLAGFILCITALILLMVYTWNSSAMTLLTTVGFVVVMAILELLYSERRIFFKK